VRETDYDGKLHAQREANAKLQRKYDTVKGALKTAQHENALLKRLLDKTLANFIEAEEHIRDDLQPEFQRLADGERLTFPWRGAYDQAEAAQRLATWWHGAWSADLIAEVRGALGAPGSSSGRTPRFDRGDEGSTPSPGTSSSSDRAGV
jgi:hypothetical protein